jgi:hypothetical protein
MTNGRIMHMQHLRCGVNITAVRLIGSVLIEAHLLACHINKHALRVGGCLG